MSLDIRAPHHVLGVGSSSRDTTRRILLPLRFLVDLVVVLGAALMAIPLRSHLGFLERRGDDHTLILPAMGVAILLWLVTLIAFGAYAQKYVGAGTAEYRTVLQLVVHPGPGDPAAHLLGGLQFERGVLRRNVLVRAYRCGSIGAPAQTAPGGSRR